MIHQRLNLGIHRSSSTIECNKICGGHYLAHDTPTNPHRTNQRLNDKLAAPCDVSDGPVLETSGGADVGSDNTVSAVLAIT